MTDWLPIKTEYINTTISQRALAVKYNLSLSTLTKKANREKWQQQRATVRKKVARKVQQKAESKIIKNEVEKIDRVAQISDKLLDTFDEAIKQLNSNEVTNTIKQTITDGKKSTTVTKKTVSVQEGLFNTKDLKLLASALKDIKLVRDDIVTNDDTNNTDPLSEAMYTLAKELEDNA